MAQKSLVRKKEWKYFALAFMCRGNPLKLSLKSFVYLSYSSQTVALKSLAVVGNKAERTNSLLLRGFSHPTMLHVSVSLSPLKSSSHLLFRRKDK